MDTHLAILCPQLGVKALTYNDLIQAQKEISAHNQQLREQTEQLEKDNQELRSQSLQLVRGAWAGAGRAVVCSRAPQSTQGSCTPDRKGRASLDRWAWSPVP